MSADFYLVGGDTPHPVAYSKSNASAVKHGKPVVVIDPEDREQVERFVKLYTSEEAGRQLGTIEALTWALREFANPTPPKPDEPTGLGAVVEDAEGRRWVRWTLDADRDAHWNNDTRDRDYAEIAVVRVLSEGVA